MKLKCEKKNGLKAIETRFFFQALQVISQLLKAGVHINRSEI